MPTFQKKLEVLAAKASDLRPSLFGEYTSISDRKALAALLADLIRLSDDQQDAKTVQFAKNSAPLKQP